EAALMVSGYVPAATPAPTLKDSLLVPPVGFGLNAAVTPPGSTPGMPNVTLPVKPLYGVMTVVVKDVFTPCVTVMLGGLAETAKSGGGVPSTRVAACSATYPVPPDWCQVTVSVLLLAAALYGIVTARL